MSIPLRYRHSALDALVQTLRFPRIIEVRIGQDIHDLVCHV
jgi:hypothetical protein